MKHLLHCDLNLFSIQNDAIKLPYHATNQNRQKPQQSSISSISSSNQNIPLIQTQTRALTVNQARIHIEGPLKKSQFYRKFLNYSSNNSRPGSKLQRQYQQNLTTDGNNELVLQKFSPYAQQAQAKDSEAKITSDTNFRNRQGESRSFQFFLQNKRQKDSIKKRVDEKVLQLRKSFIPMSVQKTSKKSNTAQRQVFNLKGKGINKLGDKDSQSRFTIKLQKSDSSQMRLNYTEGSSESQKIQKGSIEKSTKLSTIRTQWSNQRYSPQPIVRYIFQESQGYCFFQKNMVNKNATSKNIFNFNKRKYFNLRKNSVKKSIRIQVCSETTPNEIQGWIVATNQDEQMVSGK